MDGRYLYPMLTAALLTMAGIWDPLISTGIKEMWDTIAFYAALKLKDIMLHVIHMPAALPPPPLLGPPINLT